MAPESRSLVRETRDYKPVTHPAGNLRFLTAALLIGSMHPLMLMAQDPETVSTGGVLGNSVWETIAKGGTVMYVILGASIIGLMFMLDVAFRTRRSVILPRRIEAQLIAHDKDLPLNDLVENNRIVVNRALKAGHAWRNGTTDEIRDAITEEVDGSLWRLKQAARPLGIIASVTPLLGLLGTVIGIIEAFEVVAGQSSMGVNTSELARGIGKALLTTCFGLIVAIPLLLSHHFFVGKTEALMRRCEEIVKEYQIRPPGN
jgi:biopolymer transport protein ExbB